MNFRADPKADTAFLSALALESGLAPPASALHLKKPEILPADAIELGQAEDTHSPIGIALGKLLDGRLLIHAVSGAGKSWTLRRLLEQSFGLIQQIIVDPEGEFASYAEAKNIAVVDAAKLDEHALMLAAQRAREHRLSLVLDLSDLDPDGLLIAGAAFLRGLVDVSRDHWHSCLVVVDEAQLFAPFGASSGAAPSVRKAAIAALTDVVGRGRKRGLCGVLATQRLAQLAKSVTAPIVNCLIGLNTLDLDIRRAAQTIGWDASRAFDRLPMLSAGDFVAVGNAFSRQPCVLHVGRVATPHRGARPEISAPSKRSEAETKQLLEIEALVEASVSDGATRAEAEHRPDGFARVRAFIREVSFPAAAAIAEALRPLAPNAAKVEALPKALKRKPDAITQGLALLDRYGAVEFEGDGQTRVVRLARGFRPGDKP